MIIIGSFAIQIRLLKANVALQPFWLSFCKLGSTVVFKLFVDRLHFGPDRLQAAARPRIVFFSRIWENCTDSKHFGSFGKLINLMDVAMYAEFNMLVSQGSRDYGLEDSGNACSHKKEESSLTSFDTAALTSDNEVQQSWNFYEVFPSREALEFFYATRMLLLK